MEITKITLWLNNDDRKFKGFATIVLDDCLIIHGIAIIEGHDGFFVTMPSRKTQNGYKDIVYPLNNDFRLEIEKGILDKYEEELNQKLKEEVSL